MEFSTFLANFFKITSILTFLPDFWACGIPTGSRGGRWDVPHPLPRSPWLKPTRFISFDIWNHWIKKSSHDFIYDSNHKNEHTTPFSVFSYVLEFCENHSKTTPKYLLFDKHRYAYKNNIWVVSALTFNRSTGFKLRMAQKIVASLFVKTFDFLTIFVHLFDVKTGWQRTQKVTTHPVYI